MKRKRIAVIILVLVICLIPIPIKDSGRYEAVLWGRKLEHEVIDWNVQDIEYHVKYYDIYKYRIIFIPVTIKDEGNLHYAQW